MKNKQLWMGIGAASGMLILILDGRTAVEGARQGIELCLKTVIPSLFPFFLLSILLTSSFMGRNLSFLRPIGRLFRIPTGAESILISAFLGGYPVGAQSIAEAYKQKQLDRQDAQRMLAFCNNAGPAFLFGMVASMFPDKSAAWILWGIHILSALLVSFFFPSSSETVRLHREQEISATSAMVSAIKVMASVCGWVVLFRVIIAFLSRWILWLFPTTAQIMLTGLLELSNGCCELSAIESLKQRFVVCSTILALGGLCVTMQTLTVAKGLSMKYYFLGKLLQTGFSLLLSASIAYSLWLLIPFGVFFLIFPVRILKSSRNPGMLGV